MTEWKKSRFIKLFEKVNCFHFMAIEIIAESRAKSAKNLKLRIRQNAYNEKVAYDRMKNKSFYQMFEKVNRFHFEAIEMISGISSKIIKKFKIENLEKRH